MPKLSDPKMFRTRILIRTWMCQAANWMVRTNHWETKMRKRIITVLVASSTKARRKTLTLALTVINNSYEILAWLSNRQYLIGFLQFFASNSYGKLFRQT